MDKEHPTGTSDRPEEDSLPSATASPGLLLAFSTAIAIGARTPFESNREDNFLFESRPSCELNELQLRISELYASIVNKMGAMPRSDLEPGQRREALSVLSSMAESEGDVFMDAFERVFFTTSRKISDRAKTSAIRFSGDFARRNDRARLINFLIERLRSSSPSEASAAAVSLSEVADRYSIPALNAIKSEIRWGTVCADLAETIAELDGRK